jgi:cobalamin-dependent methionine synthase I
MTVHHLKIKFNLQYHHATQTYSQTQAQKHKSTKHKHTNTQTHKHTNTQTHKHTNTQTHKHTNTQTHKHTNTQTHHLQPNILHVFLFLIEERRFFGQLIVAQHLSLKLQHAKTDLARDPKCNNQIHIDSMGFPMLCENAQY